MTLKTLLIILAFNCFRVTFVYFSSKYSRTEDLSTSSQQHWSLSCLQVATFTFLLLFYILILKKWKYDLLFIYTKYILDAAQDNPTSLIMTRASQKVGHPCIEHCKIHISWGTAYVTTPDKEMLTSLNFTHSKLWKLQEVNTNSSSERLGSRTQNSLSPKGGYVQSQKSVVWCSDLSHFSAYFFFLSHTLTCIYKNDRRQRIEELHSEIRILPLWVRKRSHPSGNS